MELDKYVDFLAERSPSDDGAVDLEAFLAAVRGSISEAREALILECFTAIDAEGSGEGIVRDLACDLYAYSDSGQITFEDFRQCMINVGTTLDDAAFGRLVRSCC